MTTGLNNDKKIREYLLALPKSDEFWVNRYINFVRNFQAVGDTKERHHILQAKDFPQFKNLSIHTWNLALLSPRAHFIAHKILAKATRTRAAVMAYVLMSEFGYEDQTTIQNNRAIKSSLMKALWEDPEYRKMMGSISKEKRSSPYERRRWSKFFVSMWNTEVGEKLRSILIARANTAEAKERFSQISKGNWKDPEIRERMINGLRESNSTGVTVAKHKERAINLWKDPEYVELVNTKRQEAMSTTEFKETRSKASKTMWENKEDIKKKREETKLLKLSQGWRWYNNGLNSKFIHPNEIPVGWVEGKLASNRGRK
ncbi:hypothetical protein [Dickeya phage Coodle]|uniref:Homing endonuclease n=5 Tax=Limestonevirus limestone TaxID=1091052 RepID=A0A3G2K943_9CAUD|nr:hypothetical protein [Dickeya phage Coodle]